MKQIKGKFVSEIVDIWLITESGDKYDLAFADHCKIKQTVPIICHDGTIKTKLGAIAWEQLKNNKATIEWISQNEISATVLEAHTDVYWREGREGHGVVESFEILPIQQPLG